MSQLAFNFRQSQPRKCFDLHRFLLLVKLYAFEIVSTIIVLVLLLDFAITELKPIIEAILRVFRSP